MSAGESLEGQARRIYKEWRDGKPKSQIERDEWGDGSSHGRKFDRVIEQQLGINVKKPSKQSQRISTLEDQVRGLGEIPAGLDPGEVEVQLRHSRQAMSAALRIWNDPAATLRTGSFSLLYVTAWNSMAIALLMNQGREWRKVPDSSSSAMVDYALDSKDLIAKAFEGDAHRGLRQNLGSWIRIRNAVAHHHLADLDIEAIPLAQAGLLNYETIIVERFGPLYALGQLLSIPLQLSGFRDPGVLESLRRAQSALPAEVQAIFSEPFKDDPHIAADPTYSLRVAFVPLVRGSGRNPDVIAQFLKPGEVPEKLEQGIVDAFVLPKAVARDAPQLKASEVIERVSEAIPFRFNTNDHAAAGRQLGARPAKGQPDETIEALYAEWSRLGGYLYSEQWVERLVEELQTADGYRQTVGRDPKPA